MDVHCATCNESWDTHHLRHDEVHETEAGHNWIIFRLDEEDWDARMCQLSHLSKSEALKRCPPPDPPPCEKWEGKLTDFWRAQFKANGWEFGTSLMAVLRCPCCKNAELSNAEARREHVQLLSELLDGDEDGQVSDNDLALRAAEL